MSEYDAGSLPPYCPNCNAWEDVKWNDCVCILARGDGAACEACGGDGGWYTCDACDYTDKPGAA
jgi:hypothetical protein